LLGSTVISDTFTIRDVSEVGSTPVFKWLVVIVLTDMILVFIISKMKALVGVRPKTLSPQVGLVSIQIQYPREVLLLRNPVYR